MVAANLRREIHELDYVRLGQRHRSLDQALQLSDVAGPLVRQQRLGRCCRQPQPPGGPVAVEEVARQLQDVVAPFAKRRHTNVNAAQPIEEIRTEQFAIDQLAERPVGCRDNADVDAVNAVAADPLDGQVLDGPQQLGLRRE
jgi:hypothetical protein